MGITSCLSPRDMPVYPVTSQHAGGRVPSRVPRIFSRMMSLSAFTFGARRRLAEEIDACMRQDHETKLRSDPDRDSFSLITIYYFTLCKELVSPKSHLCIYNKKCSKAIGNCRHANGDNRHLAPGVPAGLGREIRDMPIASTHTHPDAHKHARHIPI